jgi:hypothetical protein
MAFGHLSGCVVLPPWRLTKFDRQADGLSLCSAIAAIAVTHGWKSWIGFADHALQRPQRAAHLLPLFTLTMV